MNNFDLNKLLSIISKMDKKELEENISKAKSIIDNNPSLSNITNPDSNSNSNSNLNNKSWGDLWMKIIQI